MKTTLLFNFLVKKKRESEQIRIRVYKKNYVQA